MKNEKLEKIKHDTNVLVWFDLLHTSDARVLKDQVARHLQENPYSLPLQTVSALLSLKNGEFNGEQQRRLENVLKSREIEISSFIRQSVEYLSDEKQAIEQFWNFLVDCFSAELQRYGPKTIWPDMPAYLAQGVEDRMAYNNLFKAQKKIKNVLGEGTDE